MLSLAVFISGKGSILKYLWEKQDKIPAKINLVLSSKEKSLGASWAKEKNLPTQEIFYKSFRNTTLFSQKITEQLELIKPDLIVFAGFIHKYEIPLQYQNRVMNIHPSLIPAFSGKGYYGPKVHQAVLERGVQYSGCTVHFANNHYDEGPIILQEVVPVYKEDSVETLSKRVFKKECEAYFQAIQWFAQNKIEVRQNKVHSLL